MTNKEFATKWFATIDAKDTAGLNSMMAPSHSFNNPMGPALDADGHIGMMGMWYASFDNFRHTLEHTISEGEWITIRGKVQMKHTGEFNGIPATGRDISLSWIDMMQIKDGKVANEYMEFNPMTMMAQLS
jgi:predicted ester cyclase